MLSWERDAANGGAFHMLDTLALSKACGAACAPDGRHYRGAVERAQIQIVANIFARIVPDTQRRRDFQWSAGNCTTSVLTRLNTLN